MRRLSYITAVPVFVGLFAGLGQSTTHTRTISVTAPPVLSVAALAAMTDAYLVVIPTTTTTVPPTTTTTVAVTTTVPAPPPTTVAKAVVVPTTDEVTTPQSASVAASNPPGGRWACIRQRESGGDYSINTGNSYYGAYQFLASTWNSAASGAGYGQYANGRADLAPPSVQDAVAVYWQGVAGWGQWSTAGGC